MEKSNFNTGAGLAAIFFVSVGWAIVLLVFTGTSVWAGIAALIATVSLVVVGFLSDNKERSPMIDDFEE